jgi:diguanylate cyclase (GGDEF)-like protein
MLSGMRAAAITMHTRTTLLEEACRIVHGAKQYEYSFIALTNPHTHIAHTVAWAGDGAERGGGAQFQVGTTQMTDTSVIGRVLRTNQSIVCLDIEQYSGPLSEPERGAAQPASPFVSLPLRVGSESIGALTVGAATHTHISESELLLLEQLASQISVALQTLPDENAAPHFSTLDPLTGLPKREVFCEHLALILRRRADKNTNLTVIVFDVERLREINDAHGRHVGDRLLQSVAARLKRRFGGSTDLAYCGGGTFVAVFTELRRRPDTTPDGATAIFGQPFAIGGSRVLVTIKCGFARYPAQGRDAETLVQYAQAALEKIRSRHDTPPHLPRHANSIDPSQRVLEQRLRLALSQQQFFVHYQPLIERVSGRVIAVEALLRWSDPERGLVSPGVFLPTLEHTGLIVPVGKWVLAQAARDFAHWQSLGLPKIRVAVNISPVELGCKDFADYFLNVARQGPGTPSIDIEISESTLLEDPEHLRRTLRTLRGEGVRIAVDDFGMAQASLRCLSALAVDSLKIDRSFINHLSNQPQTQAVVATIIALARAYGLRTVAEGVETIEQLEVLETLGCEQSQGYLHSPAVPAEEIELFIATRSSAGAP